MTLRRLFGRNRRLKRAQRERALEHLFGPIARRVGKILVFREHIVGATLYVTTTLRSFELAICQRGDDDSAAGMLRELAQRSRWKEIRSGEVLDCFLLEHYGSLRDGEVLLAVGITEDERAMCVESGSSLLLEKLRGAGIFPFTEERETFTDEPA